MFDVLVWAGDCGGVCCGSVFDGILRMPFNWSDLGLSSRLGMALLFSMDWRRVCWVRRVAGGAVLRS